MKSKILAIFVIFAIPILYFYNESVATLLLGLLSSGFAISYCFDSKSKTLLPTRLLCVISMLIAGWFFTVGRSVYSSCSFYASWPVFVKLCSLLLITFSISNELATNRKDYIFFYQIAALTGFLQGIMAICEYIEAPPIPSTWLDPASKELFRTRCCGIMTDPNIFAAFLSVLFIMTIALILKSDKKQEQILAAISCIFCGTGIFMTLSRGGWVALVAAIVFFIISLYIAKQKPNSQQIKTLAITAIILLIIFFSGPFKYRLFSITKPTDMTFFQRTLINKGIFKSIKKLPIVGHGLHTFTQVYPLYRIVGGDYPMNAHNEYLHSVIETGFLSSFFLGLITLFLFKLAYKNAKRKNLDNIIFSSIFVSLLVQNLSGFSSRILPTSVLIAMAVGGMLASQLKISDTNLKHSRFSQLNLLKILILVLSITVIISSLNNYRIQEKINTANNMIAGGNISGAAQIFSEVLESQPDNSSASNNLGMILLLAKQPEKAIEIWKNGMEYNKFEATFPINIARYYAETNPFMADSYYQYALQLDPASENYRVEYARFLLSQNKKIEAKSILEQGLTYSPGFHNVYKGFQEIETLLAELKN